MRMNFKDPATAVMEGIIDFHHDIQIYLIIIVIFVTWILFSLMYLCGSSLYINRIITNPQDPIFKIPFFSNKKEVSTVQESFISAGNFSSTSQDIFKFITGEVEDDRLYLIKKRKDTLKMKKITHGVVLEIVWTLLPVVVLLLIAIPSFALLYSIDEIVDPILTLKVIGHQWYWSYEYTDYALDKVLFDSYMVPESDLVPGNLRLLEVDRKVWLPINTHIRVLITSDDVLHSWAVPSFGVKMDAVPGRLNQVSLFIKREGLFYGQCSELCGVNHGFMPIVIKAVPISLFTSWINFLFSKEE